MAITVLHFCVLLSCLACMCSGGRPLADDETRPLHGSGDPSFKAEPKLYLGRRTSDDSPSRHALPARSGSYAAAGRKFAVTSGGYSLFDYCSFILHKIWNHFARKQGSSQGRSGAEHDHNTLFVFGDSLFDGGNNKYINDNSYRESNYPYGYTYFPTATGRVCDGRIVPDFIAAYAELPLIPPSLEPGADFSCGANFASAGSAVLDSDGESTINVINLKGQVRLFDEMVGKFNGTLGPGRTREMLRKAVYLFSIGGNDYLNYYDQTYEEGRVPTQTEQHRFVKDVIGNTTDAIIDVYEQGARKFVFQNVGPMGCLPMVENKYPMLNGSCAVELLLMPMLHNEELYRALTDLAERLEGFKFSIMDYFSSLYDRMMNPSHYGFHDGRTECYGTKSDVSQGAKGCTGGSHAVLCEYPSAYVFFDEGHTTQSANEQLAKLMWSGDPSVTRPYNVKQLFEEE